MRAIFSGLHLLFMEPPRWKETIMKGKFYTVMIVPHTRARFSKFKVSASFVLILSIIALAGVVATGLLPIYVHLSRARAAEVRDLKSENRELRTQAWRSTRNLAGLRERLAFFETEGDQVRDDGRRLRSAVGPAVGGVREPAESVARGPRGTGAVNGRVLREEMQTLDERSGVLKDFVRHPREGLPRSVAPSRLDAVDRPVHGMIAYGFQYRRDPFTGQRAFHEGLDIVANSGTKVIAPADGVVTQVMRDAGYGNVIFISHGNDLVTRYGHLSGFAVRVGQEVQRGDTIGYVGNTGRSSAPTSTTRSSIRARKSTHQLHPRHRPDLLIFPPRAGPETRPATPFLDVSLAVWL